MIVGFIIMIIGVAVGRYGGIVGLAVPLVIGVLLLVIGLGSLVAQTACSGLGI